MEGKDLIGRKFLRQISERASECVAVTDERLDTLGQCGPECYEILGAVLALLDCAASCSWGCTKGDHRLEFLVGRAVNSAYAGLLLASSGYYDQALSSARTLGEVANLLALFAADRRKLEEWKSVDERIRKREFSAVKVRCAIHALHAPLPVNEERYSKLSEFSIHASPNSLVQNHNQFGMSTTYPIFQPAGFLLSINEIALPIIFITAFAASLLDLDDEKRPIFYDTARLLAKSLGGILVTIPGKPWFQLN